MKQLFLFNAKHLNFSSHERRFFFFFFFAPISFFFEQQHCEYATCGRRDDDPAVGKEPKTQGIWVVLPRVVVVVCMKMPTATNRK